MNPTRRRLDPWIAVPAAALAVVVAVDLIAGPGVPLIGGLVIGPLLASLRLSVRDTAAIGFVAAILSVLLGLPNEFFAESEHLPRILPVVLAALIAVWLARLRVGREHAAVMLAVQGSVSRVLNESEDLGEAAPRILQVIGGALDWVLGEFWETDVEEDRIRRIGSWLAPGIEAAEFESASRDAAYERGEGLPGRVWASGEAVSIRDFRNDPANPRAGVAIRSGLEAAFAFPARAGNTVVGVVEFFSHGARTVGPQELEMFSALGRQIGQFVERRRGDRQRAELLERESHARMAAEAAERRAAETVALLDTLLTSAPAGFAYIDRELRYLRVNDALAAIYGRSAEEVVGASVADIAPGLPEVIPALRRVLETGEPVRDLEVSGEASDAPGRERHLLASYYPVLGAREEVAGVGAVVVDITERKRAEARSHFLAEATATLGASLNYEITLANIARLAVPELSDWCVVYLLDHETGRINRLAIAHSDPSKERLLWELDRRYPVDPDGDDPVALAIRTGEPQLVERVDDDLLQAATRDEEQLAIARDLGLASAMAVPFTARGEAIGAVTFATAESGRIFGQEDLALAVELAVRAGTAVENARLYRERSHIARTLQESLLPPRLPDIPGVELAARYRAAGEAGDVGGDFYDVFPTGPHTWGVVVGDVLGKGAGAAAMIGLARHTLRAAAMRDPDSVGILTTLNEALYRESAHESFCTAVYLAVDVSDDLMEVELTCAGHPLPLLLRRSGTVESVGRPGTLLGAVPRLSLQPHRVSLAPGDALVAFTDGVVEARSERGVFGEHRLRRLLATLGEAGARDVADRVAHHALEFQGGRPRDDLAVLVARRRADEAPPPEAFDPEELRAVEAAPRDLTS